MVRVNGMLSPVSGTGILTPDTIMNFCVRFLQASSLKG
jgi:hypothetical protein